MRKNLRDIVYKDYTELLENLSNNNLSNGEALMHEFLEQNSALLPYPTAIRNDGHHGIVSGIIFSKLPLAGYFNRVPDFVFLTKTSVKSTAIFIEIENPFKKIFNKNDDFTSYFNQAYQQLEDWKSWFEMGNNNALLQDWLHNAINVPHLRKLPLQAEYVLIYGRRSEFENMSNRIRRLNQKDRHPFSVMTYDRLYCDNLSADNITVRRNDNGYEVVGVDPAYRYYACDHKAHGHFQNIEKAIENNRYQTEFDKKKNLERIKLLSSMSDDEINTWKQKHPKIIQGLKIF